MNKQEFEILFKKEFYNEKDIICLKKINQKHPYFYLVKVYYLKALKQNENKNYCLKQIAASTQDRTMIFDYTTTFEKKTEQPVQKMNLVKEMKTSLEVTLKDTYSFSQWLKLNNYQLIKSKKIHQTTDSLQDNLINKFITENPSIPKLDKKIPISIQLSQKESVFDPSLVMTETLAKVYLEQKIYDRAIKAYEVLSLKYPKKSSLFARQIQKIKKLSKNDTL